MYSVTQYVDGLTMVKDCSQLEVLFLLMKSKKKKIGIMFILMAAVISLTLWSTGLAGLWHNGISYIANNTKEFSDIKGHVVKGNYSVSINLSDLESNIGKELYNDGTHRIYVSCVDNTGDINTGGYRIGFRSSGQYSPDKATLVSGVHHATVDNNSFTMDMSARMTAEYKGKIYKSSEFGTSGLNYKDGDDFSFYIFPTQAYESKEIFLNENGVVNLTVTGLFENIWSKI